MLSLKKVVLSLLSVGCLLLGQITYAENERTMPDDFKVYPIDEDGNAVYDVIYYVDEKFINTKDAAFYKDAYINWLSKADDDKTYLIMGKDGYKVKAIGIKVSCYDGVCFFGEVKGNDLITYDSLCDKTNLADKGSKFNLPDASQLSDGQKLIKKQYDNEMRNGGMWLKFIDYKYKDKQGKPRTFYVAKKPIKGALSWCDLYDAGVVYDDSYSESGYNAKEIDVNGDRYRVRLLRGESNYGDNPMINNKDVHSPYEWDRVMLPIIDQYREKYYDPEYDVTTWHYNWFGDLTLGATYTNVTYQYKNVTVNGWEKYYGQRNWMQESEKNDTTIYDMSSIIRGGEQVPMKAKFMYRATANVAWMDIIGWRPVLELINQ